MARARNIKPGFFTNPEVVEVSFEARLLFIALWTLADREGRLEDRPKKIKMAAFPADSVDVDQMLEELADVGLIERYLVGGMRLINIPNFRKHQSPHHKEPPSTLPPPGASPGQAPDKPETGPGQAALIADSGFLNPDSSPSEKARKRALPEDFTPTVDHFELAKTVGVDLEAEFEQFRDYHRAKGSTMKDWNAALRTWLRNAQKFGGRKPKGTANKQEALEQRNADIAERWANGGVQ